MAFLRNLKAALQYANYDFFKLKKEIIALIIQGRNQGLNNPDYCKLTVKNSSLGHDYPVFIDLYYKMNEDEAIHLPKELLIGTFVTMPSSIRQMLSDEGYVEIVIDNLTELSVSVNETIAKSIKFESILGFGSSKYPLTSRRVTIKDDIFTYRIIYIYDTAKAKEQTKAMTYADILGLPTDVASKLKSDGQCTIKID